MARNLSLKRCVLWKLHQGVVHYPGAVYEYVDRPKLFFGTRNQRLDLVTVRDIGGRDQAPHPTSPTFEPGLHVE